jgi:hypothetical protein
MVTLSTCPAPAAVVLLLQLFHSVGTLGSLWGMNSQPAAGSAAAAGITLVVVHGKKNKSQTLNDIGVCLNWFCLASAE